MNTEITFKELRQPDLEHWDDYVLKHPDHTPYHISGWSTAITEAYKHKVRFVVALHKSKIVAVLPVCEFTSITGKVTLCSLPFCDLGGALADSLEIKEGIENYIETLEINGKGTKIELRERRSAVPDLMTLEHKKVSMILPLPDTSEELLSGFKSKLRSQIRKAEKNGLTYEIGRNAKFVDAFYGVLAENLHRLGSPVHSKSWFSYLVTQLGEMLTISLVKQGELVIGAGLIIQVGDKVAIPWASTRAQYNHLSPNMLLYWSLLKHSCDHSATEFDFGRSTFNEGTYNFKKQWGCEPRTLDWRVSGAPREEIDIKSTNSKARMLIENIWRNIPLSLANYIGPKVRRFISL